ncbi:MAG: hypothetical protein AAFW00_01465 [Bacteroidota bacterium]
MNKKMMRLAAIAVSLMILFACKPEPVLPTLPANSQVEAFLTAAPWKFRSLSNEDLRADDKEVLEDIYGKLTYEFYTNGEYNLTYSDTTEDQPGTWVYDSLNRQLRAQNTNTEFVDVFDLIQVNADTLKFSFPYVEGVNELTWTH